MRLAGGYRNRSLAKTIDWWLVGCWVALVCIGLINIYAAIHSPEEAIPMPSILLLHPWISPKG